MNKTAVIFARQLHAGHRMFDSISRRAIRIKSIFKNADESILVTTEVGELRITAGFRVMVCA